MIQARHIAHFAHEGFPQPWREVVDEVLDFVAEHDHDGKVMGQANRDQQAFLVMYHLCKQTLEVCRNANEEVRGVAMWYQFNDPWTWGEIERWRPDDKGGKSIVVGYMLALDANARREVIIRVHNKIETLGGHRFFGMRNNKIKEYTQRDVSRFFRN